jgi:hypothetical protein
MDYNKETKAQLEIVENSKEFIPSQHFTKDEAFITLVLNTKNGNESETGLFVVSSNKKVVKLNDFVLSKNYKLQRKPDFENRWSVISLNNFVEGNIRSDLVGTFNKIEKLLKNYLDLGNDSLYKVLALWIIGTYTYRQFKAFPYVNINGLMNSGKSKVLELCSLLSFNGELLMNSTPAYIIRSIHDNCASIFLDEAERLKDSQNTDNQTLILMLNSGYKLGPGIGKMNMNNKDKNWSQSKYDPYSPKMIAGINNVAETLVSRSINITLIATDNVEIKNKEIDPDLEIFREIRDGLYLSVMEHFKLIKEAYNEITEDSISARNWEVWKPIVTIALVIDELRNDSNPLLYSEVIEFAKSQIKIVREISEETQTAIQLLVCLKKMIESDNTEESFYANENIKEYLIKNHSDDFAWLKESNIGRYLGPTLRKTGVTNKGSEVRWYGNTSKRGFVLKKNVISQRLRALGKENV